MAKTSINLRMIGEWDCLFVTFNHSDGSMNIGTNFTQLGRLVELTPEEKAILYRELKQDFEDSGEVA